MSALPERVTGDGPAVLLVHGWGGFKEGWGPLTEDIAAAGMRAVAVDLPGWGAARAPRGFPHRPRDYAAALAPTMSRHRPAAAIGHSLGAAPALLAAIEGAMAGLVAIAPQWSPDRRGGWTSWRGVARTPVVGSALMRAGLARARRDRGRIRASFLSAIARPPHELDDPRLLALLEEATDRFARTSTRTLATSVAPLLAFDARPHAHGLAADTLLVLGARDRVIDNGAAEWAIAPAPRARALTIPGVGHFPHLEAPDVAVPAIVAHLSMVATAAVR